MNTHSAEFRDAIECLPNGEAIVIEGLCWDDYEAVLEELQDRHLRINYDCGRLEIMSPLPEHEIDARLIDRMVYLYCDEFEIELESYGSTTWKRQTLGKGVEPDSCYYVENAARVIGKKDFDLESDPPPDIAVEIDITSKSLRKFPIYAALGVPEIWRFDGRVFQFYELVRGSFVESTTSRFLSGLPGALMAETIEASIVTGQTEALKLFRKQIRAANGE